MRWVETPTLVFAIGSMCLWCSCLWLQNVICICWNLSKLTVDHIWPKANGRCLCPRTGVLWRRLPGGGLPGASGQAGAEHAVTRRDAHAPREVMPWGSMWVRWQGEAKPPPDHGPELHFPVPRATQAQPQSYPWLRGARPPCCFHTASPLPSPCPGLGDSKLWCSSLVLFLFLFFFLSYAILGNRSTLAAPPPYVQNHCISKYMESKWCCII